MWRLLVMCAIFGTALAPSTSAPTVPSTHAVATSPPVTIPGNTTGPDDASTSEHRPWGADYQPMEGGTEFSTPFPQAVPIKQKGIMSAGDPEYPCFGTISGNNSRTRHRLLTSVYCRVEGHIDSEFTPWKYEDIALTKLIGPIRKKRQAVVALTHPFTVITYEFKYTKRLNETVFNAPGELITDVKEYHKIIGNPQSKGIVLASRPYKAGAVSLDQTNCSDFVYQIRQEPDMPENLTEGVFCVFMGKEHIQYNGVDIAPGMPCRDSLGSPVLVEGPSGYTRVLGIVIMYLCQYIPDEWGHIPKAAMATSTAYAFNYTRLPVEPFISPTWPTFPPRPPLPAIVTTNWRPAPRGESPSLTFSKQLFLLVVMAWCFVGTCELHCL